MARPTSEITMHGGLGLRNVDRTFQARVFEEDDQRTQVALRPGTNAVANLYVPANVVNGDTVTVGENTYELDIINTDSAVNTANTAAGALGATGSVALVTLGAAPGTAILAGDVIRIESELLLVLRVISTTTLVVARAYGGSSIAAHLQNLDVYVSDAVPTATISVPLVTTLTPAAFGPALVAVFNWSPPTGEERPARTAEADEDSTAYALNAGQEILFVKDEPGVDETATTEEFSASTDNVWGAATFTGGSDPGILRSEAITRVPTAAEELAGQMHFAFPFVVRAVVVQMIISATGQRVAFTGQALAAYVESTDVVLPTNVVTLRNTGALSTAYITGFAATNTLTVIAFE